MHAGMCTFVEDVAHLVLEDLRGDDNGVGAVPPHSDLATHAAQLWVLVHGTVETLNGSWLRDSSHVNQLCDREMGRGIQRDTHIQTQPPCKVSYGWRGSEGSEDNGGAIPLCRPG